MTRIQWLTCWDRLRESLSTRTSWGRQQILDEMNRIEREVVRESEIDETLYRRGNDPLFAGTVPRD